MSSEVRIHRWCDACEDAGDHNEIEDPTVSPVPVTLAGFEGTIDLCPDHMAEFIDPLLKLVSTYGSTGEVARVATGRRALRVTKTETDEAEDHWHCPECGESMTTRKSAMDHVQNIHGFERTSASRLVPPRGPSRTCECGMILADNAQAIAAHRRACPKRTK